MNLSHPNRVLQVRSAAGGSDEQALMQRARAVVSGGLSVASPTQSLSARGRQTVPGAARNPRLGRDRVHPAGARQSARTARVLGAAAG